MTVNFYDTVENEKIKFAVIISRYKDMWVFCKHKQRDTWECPGGHREHGEDALDTARRELYEETGATEYDLFPVTIYGVKYSGADEESYGLLCFASIRKFGVLPDMEIERIEFFSQLPDKWTYPQIQPILLEKICKLLKGMEKTWNLEMAQAMLTLKKDTLPAPDSEALGYIISLLRERQENPNKLLRYLRKKFMNWYDALPDGAAAFKPPTAALLMQARELCSIYRDEADPQDHTFQTGLLRAAEEYRRHVVIPVSGDAVTRLQFMAPIQKEILSDHGIPINEYFFDPGPYESEISRAIEQSGEKASQKLFGYREYAFDLTLSYLCGRLSMARYA